MTKITIFDSKPYDIKSLSEHNNYNFNLKFLEGKLNEDTAELANGSKVVCAFVNDDINSKTIDILQAVGVELIALRCAGYNNVDLKAVYGKIRIVRVPAYSPYAVAEHALALIMSLNRNIHRAYYRTKENNFNINGLLGFDMYGKTAGIIGTGKIGSILIDILLGMGVKVIAYDAFPNIELSKKRGFVYVSLEELYQKSDIISLHCPLNAESRHMINTDSIKIMKKGVMIINTSRGQLVDTKALIQALKTGKIGHAGLDVYEEESDYFFEDFSSAVIQDDVLTRLLSFPNVLITSHQAFFTKEALSNIADITFNNINEFLNGKTLTYEICYKCEKDCKKKVTGRCW
jgi:D-lactate dehydrogenase